MDAQLFVFSRSVAHHTYHYGNPSSVERSQLMRQAFSLSLYNAGIIFLLPSFVSLTLLYQIQTQLIYYITMLSLVCIQHQGCYQHLQHLPMGLIGCFQHLNIVSISNSILAKFSISFRMLIYELSIFSIVSFNSLNKFR